MGQSVIRADNINKRNRRGCEASEGCPSACTYLHTPRCAPSRTGSAYLRSGSGDKGMETPVWRMEMMEWTDAHRRSTAYFVLGRRTCLGRRCRVFVCSFSFCASLFHTSMPANHFHHHLLSSLFFHVSTFLYVSILFLATTPLEALTGENASTIKSVIVCTLPSAWKDKRRGKIRE